jgi:hypothetical protein
MTTKERILRELENLDEQGLDTLYELEKRLLDTQRANAAPPSFLERLSRIQIDGPEDFAENVDRHILQIKELEEEELAAEGYQLYAQEAVDFAA